MAKHHLSAVAAAAALALSASILTACGGGGGGSTPSPSVAPVRASAPAAPTFLIEAYGDSTQFGITYQNGCWCQNPGNAPAYLGWALQAKFGPGVQVSNQGVSGTTAQQLLLGADGVHQPWAAQMAQSKAQIVLINHGINDAAEGKETAQEYGDDLTQLVQTAKAYGKIVVLEEPNPVCMDPVKSAQLSEFVTVMDWVGQNLGVPVVKNYQAVLALPNWQGMEPDCIHPDAQLYQFIAGQEEPMVAESMKL